MVPAPQNYPCKSQENIFVTLQKLVKVEANSGEDLLQNLSWIELQSTYLEIDLKNYVLQGLIMKNTGNTQNQSCNICLL